MKVLPKVVSKRKKRLGRGYGSGRGGHTTGRGQKGQKTRGKIGVIFEGMKMKKSLIKHLPLRRGKSKFKARKKPLIVKSRYLNLLPAGATVNLETLVKAGIVNEKDAKTYGVKILGDGEVTKKLKIAVPFSKSLSNKIEKLGGEI